VVGYLTPHFPLVVPEPFYAQYKDKVPAFDLPAGLVDHLPTNYKLQRTGFDETDVPDSTVKLGRELYYGLTSWMDNEVGKVLATLRANTHIADNTIIIYTTDHGENMAEHGLWWKNCMYDHAARVPLIITSPQRWKGGQRRKLVSGHLDLVKTVIDLAGGQTPGDWNGNSLLPWLDNPNYKWKDIACTEYYAQFIAHGIVMIRTGKWKYIYHGKPAADMPVERELFNMETDPEEFHNLSGDPQYAGLVAKLHARMVKEVGGDPDETERRAVKQLAAGYSGANSDEGKDSDG
jgi:choline-sulfatase